MKDEANIVEQYADSDVGKRIDIRIRYYPNFIRLVEGFEQSLSFIIKQEKEMKRRSAIGELGVRVQNSHISDPTAREAIDNIMIMEAIKKGDLDSVISELDEDVRILHEMEIRTIRDMKEDFRVLNNTFYYLNPVDSDMLRKYLEGGSHTEQMAYDLNMKPDALRVRIHHIKKTVIEQTSNILIRKYRVEGGIA
ncbi:hypothetical protein [Oribacterium sp. FC2011]|uniref:hypothetical protein n=1 Tax=Oribacterium sp. FC2011 TaxID=1408311 RepID=UPI0004E0FB7A|nr:hypothetical protein [Oribacterium sp. FC2011]